MHQTLPLAEFVHVDGRAVINGEIDLSNANTIEDWLGSFGPVPLEVDLGGVTFFDSTALRSFLRAARRNATLRVVNPSSQVRLVLDITGTGRIFLDPPHRDERPRDCAR
jgi:anti-anti-sigma factor